jgi:CheY-like chemotaxis protein
MGTGLGLSICHRIISSLGGSITFESEVGRGTEFHIALPAAKQKSEESPQPPLAPTPRGSTRRARILIVDDEIAICTIIKLVLSQAHDVVTVNEAPRALELLRKGERFDIILCDVMIPQMTGIELYQETLRIVPEQAGRFVFMTGGSFTPRTQEFLRTCGKHQIDKPFDGRSLQALVDKMLDAAGPRTPQAQPDER